jgi:mannose-6-phosphate isomerase-like protein (cupin superfamily)
MRLSSAPGLALVLSAAVSFVVVAQVPTTPPQNPPGQGQAGAGAAGRGGGPGPGAGQAAGSAATARGSGTLVVWSPKLDNAPRWTGSNKPWTKLVDVRAAHKGQTDWTQTIVDDEMLQGDWVSMGAGKKTPRRMNADTREWWIVWDGQIKFTIEGQEPFVASKGFLVQVPYRNWYEMETVGNTPSLRFEVNVAHAKKLYPVEDTPQPLKGYTYVRTRITGQKGAYDDQTRMVVDFADVLSGKQRGGAFVSDVRSFANIILGPAQAEPAPTDKGHFHQESGEFWLVMLGKIRYRLEDATKFGAPEVFQADEGDIVYAPKQTWHLASVGGDGRGCRLAMNGYPDLAHAFEFSAEGRGRQGGGGR